MSIMKCKENDTELKTILSNTKARVNNDDPLSSNEYNSNNKQNVREVRSGEMETSKTEKIQDKNIRSILWQPPQTVYWG